jgi:hypothetical protein
LSRASAWISSTITVRAVARIARLFSAVSITYSDSGVVTRMCGARRNMPRRSAAVVSPVRTAARIGGSSMPMRRASWRISASGSSRLRWMSCESARSGETYTASSRSSSVPSSARRTSRSITSRNAASVLPEPVGAAISTSSARAIAGQPWACDGVGARKRRSNQPRTGGERSSAAVMA